MSTRFLVIKTGAFSTSEKKAMPKLKKLNARALKTLLAKDKARVILESRKENLYLSKGQAASANLETFETLYRDQAPELVKAVMAAPETSSVTVKYPNGTTLSIPLKGRSSTVRALILGSNIAKSDKHPEFMMRHIKSLLSRSVAKKPGLAAQFAKLPAMERRARVTKASATKSVIRLLDFWWKNWDHLIYMGQYAPVPCDKEMGVGRNKNATSETTGDMTEQGGIARNTALNPNGLFKNLNFPLKPHLTCIRNQANRGTCEAFGLIAAIEAAVSVKYDKKVNLSEQALYKAYKLDWFPGPFYYGDGAIAVLNLLSQALNGYVFSYEADWDYNPSYGRGSHDIPPNIPPYYTNSAAGYNGLACSETNHQAGQVCYTVENKLLREVVTTVSDWVDDAAAVVDSIVSFVTGQPNGHWVEKTVTAWEEVFETCLLCEYRTDPNPSSGYKITDFAPFYVPLMNWDVALSTAKFFLANKVPIIWEFQVMPSFDDASGGYVTDTESLTQIGSIRGGHCALIAGYVGNDKLPGGAPAGEGGGYFIVKNSWGTYKGDCGYYYVPYKYVQTWTTCMTALNSITHISSVGQTAAMHTVLSSSRCSQEATHEQAILTPSLRRSAAPRRVRQRQ